jgi:hypothetical protein
MSASRPRHSDRWLEIELCRDVVDVFCKSQRIFSGSCKEQGDEISARPLENCRARVALVAKRLAV